MEREDYIKELERSRDFWKKSAESWKESARFWWQEASNEIVVQTLLRRLAKYEPEFDKFIKPLSNGVQRKLAEHNKLLSEPRAQQEEQPKQEECTILYLNRSKKRHHDRL